MKVILLRRGNEYMRDLNNPTMISEYGKTRKGKVFACYICKRKFYISPTQIVKTKRNLRYCSKKCVDISFMTNKPLKCIICKKLFYCSKSQQKYRNRKTCSIKCRSKLFSRRMRGKDNRWWIDGKTSKRRRLRSSKRLVEWRKKVYIRDDYTCQQCGLRNKPGLSLYLHAHHLKQFAHYSQKRFTVKNGITLCKKCHDKVKHKRRKDETPPNKRQEI